MEDILYDKNVLISGAAGGIAKEIAIELASRGCNLFLTDISIDALADLKKDILTNFNVKVRLRKADLNISLKSELCY